MCGQKGMWKDFLKITSQVITELALEAMFAVLGTSEVLQSSAFKKHIWKLRIW